MWVLFGLGAMFYFWRGLLDANAELRGLRKSGKNGGYLIQNSKNRRNRRNLLVLASLLVLMGAIAMFIPNPTDPDISVRRSIQSIIAILIIAGLFWWARQDDKSTKDLDNYLKSRAEAQAAVAEAERGGAGL